MTLREWIDTLASVPYDMPVKFSDGRVPTRLVSWRGVYAELSIDSDRDGETKAGELLADAKAAVGKTFTGYKGGDYVMRESTPVWADEYGEYRSDAPTGVVVSGGVLIVKITNLSDYR